MGVIPAGQAGRSGVEGGVKIPDNDPYFRAMGDELKDKGFLVANADALTYVSNNLTDDGLRDWYGNATTTVVRRLRVAAADIDPATAKHIQERIAFAPKQVNAKTGALEEVKGEQKANKFAPVAFVYLLWVAVFTATPSG